MGGKASGHGMTRQIGGKIELRIVLQKLKRQEEIAPLWISRVLTVLHA
jgi:hypothetical protein